MERIFRRWWWTARGVRLALVFALAVAPPFHATAAESPSAIHAGSEIDFYPYVDVDRNGNATGFAVELLEAVARVQGLSVTFHPNLWDTNWERLRTGRINALPLVSRIPEREGLVEFTRPHTFSYDAFFVRRDAPAITSLAQARARRIIVVRSDAAHHALTSRGFDKQLVFVDRLSDGFRLLAAGHYDAVLAPLVQGKMRVKRLGLGERIQPGPLLREYRREYCFAVRKGDVAFRDQLDRGLEAVKASGEYDELHHKWLAPHDAPVFPTKYVVMGAGAAVTLFLLLGTWTLALRREVARRTAQLAEANASLEQRVAERTINLERAMREAEEANDILRVTMDNVPALMSYIDAQGRYRRVNQAHKNWFSCTDGDVLGRPACEVVGDAAWEAVSGYVTQVLAGERITYERQVSHPQGGTRWIHATYAPDQARDGHVRGFVVHVMDITESKKTELALRESESRFRATADTAPVLIWMAGLDKLITWFNQQWLIFTGRTLEQELGNGWLENVHPEDFELCVSVYTSSFDRRKPFQMEYRLRRSDGVYRWMTDQGVPRYDADGEFLGYIGSCVDITLRKQAEEALRDADQRKDEFLAMLAHELRNPLAPIQNAAHILGLPGLDESRLTWARNIIASQVRHLTRLVDDLLDVSRISRGRIELKCETLDLKKIIGNAVETIRPLIEGQAHRLDVSLPDADINVYGDPVRLVQVLVNLLDNAAKYTPPSGHIELTARLVGGEVEIAVKDDGTGISKNLLGRVFDLFQQGERGLDRSPGGLGIGLSLVERLLALHGGRVAASSAGPGLGAVFTLWLPLQSATSRPSGHSGQPTTSRGGCLRVMVVEDQEEVARSILLLLELEGYEVRVAANGMEALCLAREFLPDAVLLDIGLPGMDGYEVARQLRGLSFGDKLRIIAVSGYGDPAALARGGAAGFDAHLIKPVDFAQIQAELALARLIQSAPTAAPCPEAFPVRTANF